MYPCGLHGGEKLRLKKPLPIKSHKGRLIKTLPAGEIWTVIGGDTDKADVVWLYQPDGDRHTWDNETIFEWFEIVDEISK